MVGALTTESRRESFFVSLRKELPPPSRGSPRLVGRALALDLTTPSRWAGSRLRSVSYRACALDVARSPHVAR